MKASNELKSELKEINLDKLLNKSNFICIYLNYANEEEFQKFKCFAKDYASKYYIGNYTWWDIDLSKKDNNFKYLIDEKIRFINDILNDKFVENS